MDGKRGIGYSQQTSNSPGSVQVIGNDNQVLALRTPPLPPAPSEIARIAPKLVDRGDERDVITRYACLGATHPILNVYGASGVGKRAVVHDWACEHRSEFPGGQILVDVSGFSTSRRVPTFDVLRSVLYRLASPYLVREVPPDALSNLYSSLTARERMLVVVEGASSYAQVRPFVPQHDDSMVVITSERAIEDDFTFRPVRSIEIAPLDDESAAELVNEVLEELGATHLATEVNVRYIVAVSQGIPQRLVMNAQLLGRDRYRIASHRPQEQGHGVRSNYDALAPVTRLGEKEGERVLALDAFGGAPLTLPLIASVWQVGLLEAEAALARLLALGLIRADGTTARCARYLLDPLARSLMITHPMDEAARLDGVRRACCYYRELMQEVNAALSPQRLRTYARLQVCDMVAKHVSEHAPLELFDAERDCMFATVGLAAKAGIVYPWWEIGEAAWPAFRAAGYSQAGARMLSLCADVCPGDSADGRITKARLHAQAAHCFCDVGDLSMAREHIGHALRFADDLPHDGLAERVYASVHEFNGTILREEGSYDSAEAEYHLALAVARRIGRARSESIQLYLLGRVKLRRGDHASAIPYLNRALALTSESDLPMKANALAYRAKARLGIRDFDRCVKDASRAARLYDRLPSPWRLADVLGTMADAHDGAGRHEAARKAREAADLLLARTGVAES